jgi:methionyl-tRNA synthetase
VKVGEAIEAVELRSGMRIAMEAAGRVNAYLNETEPWKLVKTDRDRAGQVLWTTIQAISGIRIALSPYLPFSTERLGELLGIGPSVDGWDRPTVPSGTELGAVAPLFQKLEPDHLDDEEGDDESPDEMRHH